ncbi:MAG: hypothetical protein HYU80_00830 [Candidatus Blackburnbacteria bacterium]|nr:hypothetical protein [Candidatus Blackburnbacteria bacterium]
MKLKIIPQDGFSKKFFFAGLLSLFVSLLFLGIFYKHLPPEIPLFYSKPWGQEQLAKPILLSIPLALSIMLFSLNLIITRYFKENSLIRVTLMISSSIVAILTSITIIRIILLIS